jgi:ABC-type dipeptide/oligopeptide/nickel transport system permease component
LIGIPLVLISSLFRVRTLDKIFSAFPLLGEIIPTFFFVIVLEDEAEGAIAELAKTRSTSSAHPAKAAAGNPDFSLKKAALPALSTFHSASAKRTAIQYAEMWSWN